MVVGKPRPGDTKETIETGKVASSKSLSDLVSVHRKGHSSHIVCVGVQLIMNFKSGISALFCLFP